jgi:hypothetical protein
MVAVWRAIQNKPRTILPLKLLHNSGEPLKARECSLWSPRRVFNVTTYLRSAASGRKLGERQPGQSLTPEENPKTAAFLVG